MYGWSMTVGHVHAFLLSSSFSLLILSRVLVQVARRHVVFVLVSDTSAMLCLLCFLFFAYMALFRHVDGRSPFLILTFDCFDLHVLSFFLLFFSLKTINVSNDKVYLSLNLTHFTI